MKTILPASKRHHRSSFVQPILKGGFTTGKQNPASSSDTAVANPKVLQAKLHAIPANAEKIELLKVPDKEIVLMFNVVKLRPNTLLPLEKGRDEVQQKKLNLTTLNYDYQLFTNSF